MAPKARYTDGEKVLCFHGPLLYEAKCLQAQIIDKHMKYFIHYNGWNKNWDEWVSECRVLKYNETNLQKQKDLEENHMQNNKTKPRIAIKQEKEDKEPVPSTSKGKTSKAKPRIAIKQEKEDKEPVPSTSKGKTSKAKPRIPIKQEKEDKEPVASTSKGKSKKTKSRVSVKREKEDKDPVPCTSQEKPASEKKTKSEKKVTIVLPPIEVKIEPRDSPEPSPEPKKKKVRIEPEFEEEPEPVPEIKINVPPVLKDWLIDDGDLINRQQKILNLPARVTVDHVIASYVKEKVSVKGLPQSKETIIVQMANKIRDCFNVLLGKLLLYKFERPQYAEILAEYRGWSVCQIYGAIHLLRMFSKLEDLLPPGERGMTSLLVHLNDFVSFMSRNNNFFNLDDYIVATPEYHRRALC